MSNANLGPAMIDIAGTELTDLERQRLCHPLVGGIILFKRNFRDVAQLRQLTRDIHALRTPPLIIAVDHEGGRVQRFREGFTHIPAMGTLGQLWQQDKSAARAMTKAAGFVLAAELRASGVDLSFAPVLDLDYGSSSVIGDRAFHRQPEAVADLAGALIDGLSLAGLAAVGKHFPGHGYVVADSHLDIPRDERSIVEIAGADLLPFHRLAKRLGGIMPAHVIYEQVDPKPAGFSRFWLQQVLRRELQFQGAVFSDDLSMKGASVAGDTVAKASAAWDAGCDMVLVCNDPDAAGDLLQNWRPKPRPDTEKRILALRPILPPPDLERDADYLNAKALLARLDAPTTGTGASDSPVFLT